MPKHELTEASLHQPVYWLDEGRGRLGVYRVYVYRDGRLLFACHSRETAEELVRLMEATAAPSVPESPPGAHEIVAALDGWFSELNSPGPADPFDGRHSWGWVVASYMAATRPTNLSRRNAAAP